MSTLRVLDRIIRLDVALPSAAASDLKCIVSQASPLAIFVALSRRVYAENVAAQVKRLAVGESIGAGRVEAEMGCAGSAVTTFGVAADWGGSFGDRAGLIGELASIVSGERRGMRLKLEPYGEGNQEKGNKSWHNFVNNSKNMI